VIWPKLENFACICSDKTEIGYESPNSGRVNKKSITAAGTETYNL